MTKPISNDRKVRRSRSVGRGAGTADVLVPLAFFCGAIAMFIAGLPGIGWLIVAVGVMASVAVVSRCSPKFRWGPLLMVALVPLLSGVAVAPVAQADAPGNFPGWARDYVDDFNAPLDVTKWGRYESSTNQSGMLSEYDLANVYTTNGSMVLKTYNVGGTDWRAGAFPAPEVFQPRRVNGRCGRSSTAPMVSDTLSCSTRRAGVGRRKSISPRVRPEVPG